MKAVSINVQSADVAASDGDAPAPVTQYAPSSSTSRSSVRTNSEEKKAHGYQSDPRQAIRELWIADRTPHAPERNNHAETEQQQHADEDAEGSERQRRQQAPADIAGK